VLCNSLALGVGGLVAVQMKNEHYTVEVDSGPECINCGAGTQWTVVGDDIAIGESFGRKEDAEELAEYMNQAFEQGRRNA
jgi:hypothetical protein